MFGMLNPMSAVTSQMGGGESSETDKEKEEEAERERLEALAEQEERRKEKHRKLEEEREAMRQGIRDKYKIEKKIEPEEPSEPAMPDNPLMRKKKTPEELAAEAEAADQDEFTKLKNTIETQISEVKQQIEGKCVVQ
ncbi:Synaphin [Trinorchestia longiramus]|nr:Synaphin [Trinorchestia longiramus]